MSAVHRLKSNSPLGLGLLFERENLSYLFLFQWEAAVLWGLLVLEKRTISQIRLRKK